LKPWPARIGGAAMTGASIASSHAKADLSSLRQRLAVRGAGNDAPGDRARRPAIGSRPRPHFPAHPRGASGAEHAFGFGPTRQRAFRDDRRRTGLQTGAVAAGDRQGDRSPSNGRDARYTLHARACAQKRAARLAMCSRCRQVRPYRQRACAAPWPARIVRRVVEPLA
jgi:hypothetical protein